MKRRKKEFIIMDYVFREAVNNRESLYWNVRSVFGRVIKKRKREKDEKEVEGVKLESKQWRCDKVRRRHGRKK